MTVGSNQTAALLEMWGAAISAALPAVCLQGYWPPLPGGRLAMVACGKAAAGMAEAAAQLYGRDCDGLVILPDRPASHSSGAPGFRYFPASHPVPDERSVAAARAALELASSLTENDLLLVLLSGGGSSLMCLPAAGLTLEDKQALSRQLLACGATIQEINCVRRHLSGIKGGRLALACRASLVTLAISDVPGDDPAMIASGPTVIDRSTPADAYEVLARHGIEASPAIRRTLEGPCAEAPIHPTRADRDRFQIVASGMTALQAAAEWCFHHRIEPMNLGDELQGEARDLARVHARMALELARAGKTVCLLSGGETTVTLCRQPGRGGRNSEYALALAQALDGHSRIWALVADTDGIDGSGSHSGALVDPQTLMRASQAGLDAGEHLRRNDSAAFFERSGGLLTEGPTGTNVNDFRAILINPPS